MRCLVVCCVSRQVMARCTTRHRVICCACRKRLKRFFETLYACLNRGARAVLQVRRRGQLLGQWGRADVNSSMVRLRLCDGAPLNNRDLDNLRSSDS